MLSAAIIDTGKMKEGWYEYYAYRSVILTLIAQLLNTVFCWVLHSKTKALSTINLYFKTGLMVLLIIQLLLTSLEGKIHYLSKLLEWTMTVTIVMGFYSMGLDVDKFQFIY
jgi:hypothetical protein